MPTGIAMQQAAEVEHAALQPRRTADGQHAERDHQEELTDALAAQLHGGRGIQPCDGDARESERDDDRAFQQRQREAEHGSHADQDPAPAVHLVDGHDAVGDEPRAAGVGVDVVDVVTVRAGDVVADVVDDVAGAVDQGGGQQGEDGDPDLQSAGEGGAPGRADQHGQDGGRQELRTRGEEEAACLAAGPVAGQVLVTRFEW